MDDMDTHNLNSRTSTICTVTFNLAGSPNFLNGVVCLLWFGITSSKSTPMLFTDYRAYNAAISGKRFSGVVLWMLSNGALARFSYLKRRTGA